MTGSTIAGRYRLVELLGAGGMSEVWAADDAELDRRVALKLLAPQADTERFRREARAVAALGHPNVNQLYDYGEADGRPYMVLECLTEGSLADRLEPGRPLPDAETRQIARDIAAGLEHAHARGLVHRDLKPANVLFDSEGRAKIADFGIARLAQEGELTETGTVLGTATTISPEQAVGEPATPASDVYSFGALLFWMLTGRPPFLSDRPLDLLHLHRDATPPTPASLRGDVPGDLAALATAALAKTPADRPADGAELVRLLGTSAAATQPLPRATPPPRRRRAARLALAGLVLVGVAAAGTVVALAVAHDGGSSGSNAPSTALSLTLPRISTAHVAPPTLSAPTATTRSTTASTRSTPTAPSPPTTRVISTIAPPTTSPPPATTTVELTTTAPADVTTSSAATTTVPG